MELSKYQKHAMETCVPESNNPLYMLMEIGEEVGELQGKFSKAIRKGKIVFFNNVMIDDMKDEERVEFDELVKKEIGDVLWGLSGLCSVLDWDLGEIAQMNLDKLADRKNRKVIVGNGDKR